MPDEVCVYCQFACPLTGTERSLAHHVGDQQRQAVVMRTRSRPAGPVRMRRRTLVPRAVAPCGRREMLVVDGSGEDATTQRMGATPVQRAPRLHKPVLGDSSH